MIDGEGVLITAHMIGSSGINEQIVGFSQEAAACHDSIGVISRLVRRGSCGGRLFLVFLFSEFIGGLLKVAVVMGMTLAGKIPTLDIRIRGAGRPLIIVVGGLAAFVALSTPLGHSKCLRRRHSCSLFRLYVAQRLLDGHPGSGPAIRKVSNLRFSG